MNSGGVALNGAWFWVGWVVFLSWTLEGLAQVEFPGDADGDAVGEESALGETVAVARNSAD